MTRIGEVMPNPSSKTHEELDGLSTLDSGSPAEFGQLCSELKKACPSIKVFGGCCGSTVEHLKHTAVALKDL